VEKYCEYLGRDLCDVVGEDTLLFIT